MSAAACKIILCDSGAGAGVRSYMIKHPKAGIPLLLAANHALWSLENVKEITHLLAEQDFTITREQAHDLIEAMEIIEEELADVRPQEAIPFLHENADAIHTALLALHLAVTGEEVSEY